MAAVAGATRIASVGKQGLLAFFVVLALLAAAWLATVGTRPGRSQGDGPVETSSGAGVMEVGEEALTALPLESETRRANDAPLATLEEGLLVTPKGKEGRPSTATLALRLVARETKAPLRGVSVQLSSGLPGDVVYVSGSRGDERTCPRSDADGRVELEARPWGGYSLQIDPLGKSHVRPERFQVPELEPGQRHEVEIEVMTRDDRRWFGRVLDDETGAPLSGARVEWDESWPAGEPAPIVSGADGLLALEFASWRKSSVRVVHEGYREAAVALAAGHETPELAEAVRLVRPARLSVRVRDGSGVPLREVAVEVRFAPAALDSSGRPGSEVGQAFALLAQHPRATEVFSAGDLGSVLEELGAPFLPTATARAAGDRLQAYTDAEGRCAFEGLPPGVDGEAIARRPGEPAQRQALHLASGEARELDFEFGSACNLRGRVEDEEGRPVAGLDLWRLAGEKDLPGYLDSEHESGAVDKLRTDAEGRFLFRSVPAGAWWIGAAPYERRGGASVPLTTRIVVTPGERVREMVLTCPAALYIRGRVRTEAGGPLAAEVTASREDSSVRATADARGNFVLGPLPAGAWELEAAELPGALGSPPGSPLRASSGPVRAYAGATEVELRLRAGGALSGIVLDASGTPAPGAEVEAYCEQDGSMQRAACDERGAFRLEGLAAGSYRLLARAAESVRVLGPVHVEAGRWSPPVELRLAPGAVLRLQLAADRGERRAYALAWNGTPWRTGMLQGGVPVRLVVPAGTLRCELRAGPEPDALVGARVREAVLLAGEESELVFSLDPSAPR